MRTPITNDPYGLRAAFVGGEACCEDREALERIITSKDPDKHAYVVEFLERMRKAVGELGVFEYLNSYWNRLVPEAQGRPTGYAFLCGEHVLKTFAEDPNCYRSLWSEALVSYRDRPLEECPSFCPNDVPKISDFGNLPLQMQMKLENIVHSWKGCEVCVKQGAQTTFSVEHRAFFKRHSDLLFSPTPFEGTSSVEQEKRVRVAVPPEAQLGKGLIQKEFDSAWKELGKALHQWRANPSLEGAQVLRKALVEIDEIDRALGELPQEQEQEQEQDKPHPKRVMNAVLSHALLAAFGCQQ